MNCINCKYRVLTNFGSYCKHNIFFNDFDFGELNEDFNCFEGKSDKERGVKKCLSN